MKAIATSIAAVLVPAAALIPTAALSQARPEVFKIGEIAPLSGPAATVGTRLHQVSSMWAEEVNRRGGIRGKRVEISTCNDEGRPEKAVTCARDLVAQGSVLLINNSLTASIQATLPVVAAKGPVMIVPSPNIAPSADTFVFQVSPSDFHITKALAAYAKANKVQRIGMVAATDSSGEVGITNAQKVFSTEGIELRTARIDLRSTDASSQLASVATADTKLIFSSYSGAGAATVVKSYSNLDLKQPLIVSYANLSAPFIATVKDMMPSRLLATGIAAIVPAEVRDTASRERATAFAKAYQDKYRELPDMLNYLGKLNVDTVEAVLTNVKQPEDARAVRDFLQSTPIKSVQTLQFSKTSNVGLTEKDVIIVEWKQGTWVKADPIK
ncbi:MAG TPA: ABC transporter substrate-binding protein [Ramlibacter sp.]|nr:ABC transporter substrate-binding protein [Ramlibacter sp.]